MKHHTYPRRADPEITAYNLWQVLQQRRIEGAVVTPLFDGPQIETYRISHFHARTKPEEIERLAGAFAMAAGAKSARVSRGEGCLYVEIPKPERERRPLHPAILEQGRPPTSWHVVLGVGVDGRAVWLDIAAAESPHLLVSGTTGSGKTVALWWITYRLMHQNPPRSLRVILGGPKRFQLEPWARCAHLLHPPEWRPGELVKLLLWARNEMECRMDMGNLPGDGAGPPRILLVVDEMAYLARDRRIRGAVEAITATGREAGVHLILATQYPKVEVLTSLGIANFPARLAGRTTGVLQNVVATGKARTMADSLLGKGDFLFIKGDQSEPVRVQLPLFEPTPERLSRLPQGEVEPLELGEFVDLAVLAGDGRGGHNRKPLDWREIETFLAEGGTAGALSHRFGINYNRAKAIYEAFWDEATPWPP